MTRRRAPRTHRDRPGVSSLGSELNTDRGSTLGDLGTTVKGDRVRPGADGAAPPARPRATVRPRRGLPGGRAVVGAFLVAAAAVGTFAAYAQATATPDQRWVVASGDIAPGTVLEASHLALVAIDLPERVAGRAVSEDRVPQLLGTVPVAPLEADDLILDSAVAATGDVEATFVLSIPVARSRALQGALWQGQTVDVIATYTRSGQAAETRTVVEGARVVEVSGGDGGLGQSTIVLTLGVQTAEQVRELAHASVVADVSIVRPGPGTHGRR